ncbi:MAG: superoxide dismutase, partial [Bacteroidales bacterium]
MNKRDFIKTGLVSAAGLIGMPVIAKSTGFIRSGKKEFLLPELPYAYDALEPYIDKETMMIHHDKHHAGYTSKFNAAVQELPVVPSTVREILSHASEYNDTIINNGGGYLNHKMFWKCMSPKGGGNPDGPVADAIQKDFGTFESFKEQFSTAAKTHFGSGWAWLIFKDGKLKVTTTANQDNPFMDTL